MHTIRAIRLLAATALACVLPPVLAQTNSPLTDGAPAPIERPVTPSAPVAASAAAKPAGQAVVRQVPSPAQADAAAPSAAPAATAPAPREEQFGDITRGLIGLQASGQRAGPGQPLQGAVATAAWKRYMKSFEHPIPQWFGDGVQQQAGVVGLGQ